MNHWPPTDGLCTHRVVSRDHTDTFEADAPPTWYRRDQPDFLDNILPPQEATQPQPTFRRLVEYPPLYSTASAKDPDGYTMDVHLEDQGNAPGHAGDTIGEDKGDGATYGEGNLGGDQEDGAIGCLFAPPEGATAYPPYEGDTLRPHFLQPAPGTR